MVILLLKFHSYMQLGQWSSCYSISIHTVGAMVILIFKFHSHSWGNGHPTTKFPSMQSGQWSSYYTSSIRTVGQWSSYYRVPSTQLGQWSSFFYTSSIHTVGPMVILLYKFHPHCWGNGQPTIQVLMKQLG